MSEILGVLFAVFVGILIIPNFGKYQQASNDNSRTAATSQQQKQVYTAAGTYIQQNVVAIQAAATPTTPAIISVAMLQATNLLPASFSSTNPYGQTWQVEVLQPSAGNLQTLVMSTGGIALSDAQASKIATTMGANGGFIPKNDSGVYPTGNAYGAFAGWTIPTANYTSVTGGHPAALLSFNNGQLTSNYLYRNAVPGQPQLNQMSTAIDMTGNNINNAGAVNAASVNATGNVTAANGRVVSWNAAPEGGVLQLVGANGVSMYLENNNGVFRLVNSPWSAQLLSVDQSGNVAAAGKVSVPAGNNLVVGNTAYYGDGSNSAIRQNGGLYVQHYDGSPADIPEVGNVASSGTVSAGYITSTGNVNANGTATSSGISNNGYLYNGGNAETNDIYIRSIGQWASQLAQRQKGNFQITAFGVCLVGNPYTGGCSCPWPTNPYFAGAFFYSDFWGSLPDWLYQCLN